MVVPDKSKVKGNTTSKGKAKKTTKSAKVQESEESNTTQIPCAKYWSMTLNNYTNEDLKIINYVSKSYKKINKYIFGFEIGEKKGTKHLQGFVSFYDKVRPHEIYKIKSIHWEKTYAGEKANIEYCSKCDNIFTSNYIIPEKINVIHESNLYEWQKEYLNIIKMPICPRHIHWVWGDQNIGKTSFQKYLVVNHGAVILDGTSKDMMNGIVQYMKFNNNRTPKLIVSNIPFDVDVSTISYKGYESIKDMCFYSGKYEGGMVCSNPPHIILFSNSMCMTSNTRFVCKEIKLTEWEIDGNKGHEINHEF